MSHRPTDIPTRAWQRLRQWWAQQLPLPCARCGQTIRPGEPFDLDHMQPLRFGGTADTARPSHPACNRRAGQEIRSTTRHTAAGIEDKNVAAQSRQW